MGILTIFLFQLTGEFRSMTERILLANRLVESMDLIVSIPFHPRLDLGDILDAVFLHDFLIRELATHFVFYDRPFDVA